MNDTIGNRMLTLRVEHDIPRTTLAKELDNNGPVCGPDYCEIGGTHNE